MYHAYEQNFRMEGHIRIYMGIQNGKRIPPFYQEILHSQPWSGNIQQANNQIREYMFDFQLDHQKHLLGSQNLLFWVFLCLGI